MMPLDWEAKYCKRVSGMYGPMTRQLMHLTDDPEVISLGGGLPAWDLFPIEMVRDVVDRILHSDAPATLQYGTSEGYELRIARQVAVIMAPPIPLGPARKSAGWHRLRVCRERTGGCRPICPEIESLPTNSVFGRPMGMRGTAEAMK